MKIIFFFLIFASSLLAGPLDPPPWPMNDYSKKVTGRNTTPTASDTNNFRSRISVGSLLGEKLRRAAAYAALAPNQLTNPPWNVPPDWATSTAYTIGQVIKSNSAWYVCGASGISASTGTGPNFNTAAFTGDGTTAWTYLGPSSGSNDPAAPTVTTVTSTPAGFPVTFPLTTYPNAYRAIGGYPVSISTTGWLLTTFNKSGSTTGTPGAAIEFQIKSCTKFALQLTGFSAQRVAVDDRYITLSSIPQTGATTTWIVVDFNGVLKDRKVRFEGGTGGCGLRNVYVEATAIVCQVPVRDNIRVVCISDSLFAGSGFGPYLPGGTTALRMAAACGWSDVWNFSIGGTGYLATGSGTGSPFYTYRQRVPEALTLNPDIWLLAGSVNDIGQTAGVVTAEVTATLTAIRAGSSSPILVYGVWPYNNAGVSANELAVQAGVTAMNDPSIIFIPEYNAVPAPWILGSWTTGLFPSSANNQFWISSDSLHPPDQGTARLVNRMIDAYWSFLPNF